jgi:hypothetical protein
MKALIASITFFGLSLAAQALFAQELPAMSGAEQEHEWLKKFVGQWDVVSEGHGGEGQPAVKGKAVMKSSMLGQLWLVNASDMEISGMKMKSIQMIGYDPNKKKYVGIWADSMVNHMWQYEGTVDEAGKKLTLDAEGPSMTGDGTMTNYRDAYEFKDDNTIIATSSMQGEDGEWTVIMEGTAKRRQNE